MSATDILARLSGVRQTAVDKWIARCPAHEDRSPSLSIRQLDDGTTLLNCFAGCVTDDVLAALGMGMRDLFRERLPGSGPAGRVSLARFPIPAADLLVILDHEITVAALILSDIVERRTVNESQVQRLILAAARMGKARDIARPAKAIAHAA